MSRNRTNRRSSGWGGISLTIGSENGLRPDMFRRGKGKRHESGNMEGVCDSASDVCQREVESVVAEVSGIYPPDYKFAVLMNTIHTL